MTDDSSQRLILSIETSGDVCSVALLENKVLLSEHIFLHRMHLSEILLSHVKEVLREFNFTLEDVTDFAVGIGPGSFTGTRIGVMTMKTLTSLASKPLWGVGSLEATAYEYLGAIGALVVPIIPCRRGIVFAGAYDVSADYPAEMLKIDAYPLNELTNRIYEISSELKSSSVLFCGSAVERYKAELTELIGAFPCPVAFGGVRYPRANSVGAFASQFIHIGKQPDDPISLVPLYISPPPITMPKVRI